MNKNTVNYRKIFTLAIIIIVLIMTFLPVNVYEIDTGDYIKTTGEPIIIYEYRSFFVIIFRIIHDIDAYFFYFGMAFFLYYASTLIAIFTLLIDKKIEANISIVISGFLIGSMAFLYMYITWFAVVMFVVYMFLFVVNVVGDTTKEQRLNAKKLAIKKTENDRIANNIKNKRKEMMLTQQQVAEQAFMSRSLFSKIESGSVFVSDEQLQRIANCFGVTVDELNKKTPES